MQQTILSLRKVQPCRTCAGKGVSKGFLCGTCLGTGSDVLQKAIDRQGPVVATTSSGRRFHVHRAPLGK